MDYQSVPLEWAYRLLNHGPLVLVSTTDGMKPNVCTVAWCAPCSKSPPTIAISIGKRHKTYKNIMKTGHFGLNIPTADLLDLVWYCGSTSGNNIDKVSEGKVEMFQGHEINRLPLVAGCSAWLECSMIPGAEAGDHGIIVAQVSAAGCRPGAMNQDYNWNVVDHPTLHHLGGKKFAVANTLVKV